MTVNEDKLASLSENNLMKAVILVDNVCAWDLERTEIMDGFVRNAKGVKVYGAYEDICIKGAGSVF